MSPDARRQTDAGQRVSIGVVQPSSQIMLLKSGQANADAGVICHGSGQIDTPWARILVRVTIHRRLRIGRDGHLDQSEAYDVS